MERNPRMILVPFPITPLVAFEYFLLRRLGRISQGALARFRTTAGVKSVGAMLGNGIVYNLVGRDSEWYITSLFPNVPPNEKGAMRRLLSYCVSGDPQRGHRLYRWLIQRTLADGNPGCILTNVADFFEGWLADGIDPWGSNFNLPKPDDIAPLATAVCPPDKRYVTLPIFKSREPGEKVIIASVRRELLEGRIRELESAHIGIAIGGQPGSGKSTLTASLAAEFANIIDSLKSRHGWENLSLTVEVANLDFATPTVDTIAVGTVRRGADAVYGMTQREADIAVGMAEREAEALRRRKQPWTEALAFSALESFAQAKARANIVLADLPGKISPLTEIVAAPADVAILLTRDWSFMPEW